MNPSTTFEVYLPQTTGSNVSQVDSDVSEIPQGGNETILLVEDDQSVHRLSRAILADYGYDVIETANAQEAIDVFRQRYNSIHILVTDVIISTLNSTSLTEQILEIRPGLPVLFMSGYAGENEIRDRLIDVDSLHKPFKPVSLAQKIRKTLDFRKQF